MLKKNFPVIDLDVDFSMSNYLKTIVESLSFTRIYNTYHNRLARNIIIDEFEAIGHKARVEGDYGNIVVGDLSKAKYLIGSHYDTVPETPGADDNASAIAVMLAVASKINSEEVCFVSFNCEEFGLKGSTDFVANLPKDHKLEQVHILEMVGYKTDLPNSQKNPISSYMTVPTVGDFIGFITNDNAMLKQVLSIQTDVKVVGFTIPKLVVGLAETFAPHVFRSDHAPFWRDKISAAMWTDTAEFRNSNYHSVSDTPDTLDYEFMSGITRLLTNIVSKQVGIHE